MELKHKARGLYNKAPRILYVLLDEIVLKLKMHVTIKIWYKCFFINIWVLMKNIKKEKRIIHIDIN